MCNLWSWVYILFLSLFASSTLCNSFFFIRYEDNDVVLHPFFGTQKVVDELKEMKGWKEGRVDLYPTKFGGKCMERGSDGLVCGFIRGIDEVGVLAREL